MYDNPEVEDIDGMTSEYAAPMAHARSLDYIDPVAFAEKGPNYVPGAPLMKGPHLGMANGHTGDIPSREAGVTPEEARLAQLQLEQELLAQRRRYQQEQQEQNAQHAHHQKQLHKQQVLHQLHHLSQQMQLQTLQEEHCQEPPSHQGQLRSLPPMESWAQSFHARPSQGPQGPDAKASPQFSPEGHLLSMASWQQTQPVPQGMQTPTRQISSALSLQQGPPAPAGVQRQLSSMASWQHAQQGQSLPSMASWQSLPSMASWQATPRSAPGSTSGSVSVPPKTGSNLASWLSPLIGANAAVSEEEEQDRLKKNRRLGRGATRVLRSASIKKILDEMPDK